MVEILRHDAQCLHCHGDLLWVDTGDSLKEKVLRSNNPNFILGG